MLFWKSKGQMRGILKYENAHFEICYEMKMCIFSWSKFFARIKRSAFSKKGIFQIVTVEIKFVVFSWFLWGAIHMSQTCFISCSTWISLFFFTGKEYEASEIDKNLKSSRPYKYFGTGFPFSYKNLWTDFSFS